MQKKRGPISVGRLIAMGKAIWDLYWYVVFPAALRLDASIRKRRAKKKREEEAREKKKASDEAKRP